MLTPRAESEAASPRWEAGEGTAGSYRALLPAGLHHPRGPRYTARWQDPLWIPTLFVCDVIQFAWPLWDPVFTFLLMAMRNLIVSEFRTVSSLTLGWQKSPSVKTLHSSSLPKGPSFPSPDLSISLVAEEFPCDSSSAPLLGLPKADLRQWRRMHPAPGMAHLSPL